MICRSRLVSALWPLWEMFLGEMPGFAIGAIFLADVLDQ
jgi:hypothetical protein